ncbi:MAG: hypothetical protein HY073_03960 [Deltaproteobacteria bacterium]|nr:hypothetical protein [Deltaproteobacteria bacterium]
MTLNVGRLLGGFDLLQGVPKHPLLEMQQARDADLFQDFDGRIAQIRDAGMITGRRCFDQFFLPVPGVPQNVAELGAGDGEFALDVARNFPDVCYWAIDKRGISQLQRGSLPPNIYDCSPCEFSILRTFFPPRVVAPFDLVYVIMPLPQAISDYVTAASHILSGGGLVHMITEDRETLDFTKGYFRNKGLETRHALLPDYLMPNTAHIQGFLGVESFHWLVAR